MKKKITKKDVAYIKNYKKKHLLDYLVNWTIEESNNTITVRGNWKILIKIIFTLPIALCILFYSLWDGGLKEGFENIKNIWFINPFHEHVNYYNNSRYARMKKVLDKH